MTPQLSEIHASARTEFSTTDADVAMDYYPQAYRTPMRFRDLRDGVAYKHSRLHAELFAVEELQLPRMDVAVGPLNSLIVVDMQEGRVGRGCAGVDECFVGGDVLIAAEPSLPSDWHFYGPQFRTAMLDLAVLAQVATAAPTRAPGPIRFTGFQPISRPAAANWKLTVNYLAELLANTEVVAQPVIRGSAARLLAATALSTFPNTALVEPTGQDRRDATSATVRRAVAFIEQHPDRDISVADIAGAAHVSIRAVQVAFRRHLNTTPMEYLRGVRLDHVRRELLAARPTSGTTVTDVATRWGFYNHSRFAARYRRAYGVAPRDTLWSA
jgi:AraC-like DNA-binding protein